MPKRFFVPILLILVALILIHGFIPDEFVIDSTTLGLLTLVGALFLAANFRWVRQHISELNLFGSGVRFRDEVDEAHDRAEAIAASKRSDHPSDDHDDDQGTVEAPWPVFVQIPDHLKRLIHVDPRLAVVGLGIEVERALLELAWGTGLIPRSQPISLREAVEALRKHHRIDAEEEGLLAMLMRLRDWALHGAGLTESDARKFFDTVESLNDFSVGYSLNLSPNEGWEEQGLICRFEHCIERMPLKEERGESSCGFWGHECPGGSPQVAECAAKGLFDLPGSAHAKSEEIS